MDTTKTYRSARHLFPWGTGQPSSPKDNEPQRSRAVRGQGAAAQTMSRQLEQNEQNKCSVTFVKKKLVNTSSLYVELLSSLSITTKVNATAHRKKVNATAQEESRY
jgi:hypothetical protein